MHRAQSHHQPQPNAQQLCVLRGSTLAGCHLTQLRTTAEVQSYHNKLECIPAVTQCKVGHYIHPHTYVFLESQVHYAGDIYTNFCT